MVQLRDDLVHSTVLVDDEDEVSGISDSDDEMTGSAQFVYNVRRYANPAATGLCSWCRQKPAIPELSLVNQHRVTKDFCSEHCQELFRQDTLKNKVCEWCKQSYSPTTALIVMEPSIHSVPLQFCTSACVNKYKMDVFCAEVREQLKKIKEENIQIRSLASEKGDHRERKILITPELWSKGESAVVFVNEDQDKTEPHTSPIIHSSGHTIQSTERKRKVHSVETVISKISKQAGGGVNYRSNERDSRENRTSVTLENSRTIQSQEETGRQATPMNLSLNRHCCQQSEVKYLPNECKTDSSTPGKVNFSAAGFIPIPILIPIPVPIPIPIGTLSACTRSDSNHLDSSIKTDTKPPTSSKSSNGSNNNGSSKVQSSPTAFKAEAPE